MSLSRLSVLVFGFVAFSVQAADSKPEFETVTLPESGVDFALHPDKGSLAVLQKTQLLIYPDVVSKRSTDKVNTIKLNRSGSDLIFKRHAQKNYFVVLAAEENLIYLIDADQGEIVEKISLSLDQLRNLMSSNDPNDPYVYYCGGTGHDCKLARINLQTRKNEGPLTGTDSVARAVISGDGSIVYTHGPWSPSGFRSVAIDSPTSGKGSLQARQIHYDHTSVRSYLPDPFGQFVVCDGTVYSPDLKTNLSRLKPNQYQFISTTRPFLLGIDAKTLEFVSVNSFRTVFDVELPKAFQRPKEAFPRFDQPIVRERILEHPGSETLLFCRERNVALLGYKDSPIAKEPFMTCTLEGSRSGNVGARMELKIKLKDPQVKASIKEAPKGMQLLGGLLIWTPMANDVGSTSVKIQLTAGEIQTVREFPLTVRMTSLDVGFTVNQLAVTSDGSHALASEGGQIPELKYNPNQPAGGKLALIDLKKFSVAESRSLTGSIRAAAIDEHFVYAAAADSETLYVLNRKDLSDVKRLFTTGRPTGLTTVGNKFLFVTSGQTSLVLKVPELTLADPKEVGLGNHLSSKGEIRNKPAPVPCGDGWWFDGVLFDGTLSKAKIVTSGRSTELGLSPNSGPMMDYGYPANSNAPIAPSWVSPWSVSVQSGSLLYGRRNIPLVRTDMMKLDPIYAFNSGGSRSVVLKNQPAVALVRQSIMQSGNQAKSQCILQFHDLIEGTAHVSTLLSEEMLSSSSGTGPIQILSLEDRLLIAAGKQVYLVPIPTLSEKSFVPTLRLVPTVSVFQASEKSTTAKLPEFQGGKAPIEISLSRPRSGWEIDSKTSTLTVDPEKLRQEARTVLTNDLVQLTRLSTPSLPMEEALLTYQRQGASMMDALGYGKPTGIPVLLSQSITARDANLQSVEAFLTILIELSPEEAKQAIATPNRPESKLDPSTYNKLPPTTPKGTPSYEDLLRSNLLLEERVNRLERQLLDMQLMLRNIGISPTKEMKKEEKK
jgi:hypothetical protein